MFCEAEAEAEIEEIDGLVILIEVKTPLGRVEILGRSWLAGRTLLGAEVHLGGLSANALGAAGLNAIAQKVLKDADVDSIIIQGGVRTSGRLIGKRPREFRYPRGRTHS